ncbi:condensation domain-containing protein, partial [Streptomyces sp. NPDC013489]|uniref:condensation domain-containing protein n=1 Tax=Streptomyces sp. NPDC013489 TaxID=3155606 RepID=UPI0033C2C41B
MLVDLEGHGREEVAAGLDVTRTVGWFTTVYPVCLEPGHGDVGSSVKQIKEQLREIPDKGIGYGLLRYAHPDTAAELERPSPQIGFNYLGRFHTDARSEAALAQTARLSFGTDAGMPLAHVVEVNALAEDSGAGPELRAVWSWAGELLSEGRVAELARAWFEELTALVEAVAEGVAGGRTPSDFPLVELTQSEIETLELELASAGGELVDVLSLSPLQEGLAFHAGYDQDRADVYVAQWVLELTGAVDADRLRDAMSTLLDRHGNLRAGFRQSAEGVAYQVIADGVAVPFRVVDVSAVADAEAAVEELAAEERARPFVLDAPPLVRLVLARLAEDRFRLVFTNHHILLDGWSMPVLFGELFTLYRQGAGGLGAVRPYGEYLSWLAGADRGAAELAWREALEGVGEPTLIAPAYRQAAPEVPARLFAGLGEPVSVALSGLAREWGVTVNTLVQAAWGVLIAGMTGRRDVVFGAVVSG